MCSWCTFFITIGAVFLFKFKNIFTIWVMICFIMVVPVHHRFRSNCVGWGRASKGKFPESDVFPLRFPLDWNNGNKWIFYKKEHRERSGTTFSSGREYNSWGRRLCVKLTNIVIIKKKRRRREYLAFRNTFVVGNNTRITADRWINRFIFVLEPLAITKFSSKSINFPSII